MEPEKGIRLLHEIQQVLTGSDLYHKQREQIVGKILNLSYLMQYGKHKLGPIFDFAEGITTKVVEETLVRWTTKIKRAMKGLEIP